jgi:hypothetical protein
MGADMSRKDYVKIAAAIQHCRAHLLLPDYLSDDERCIVDRVTLAVANVLAADNPRFDAARFLAACKEQVS